MRTVGAILGLACIAGLYWLVGGAPHLFEGHDHWCTGHLMLMAESYLGNNFATPWLWPVEDRFGRIGDQWSPYTGWPPLVPLLLGGFLQATETSLLAGRAFALFWTASSVLLFGLIARRVFADRWTRAAALVLFAGHAILVQYCTLIVYDTVALTWSLLLVLSYPSLVVRGSWWSWLGFAGLTALGCLLSWHCYLVAPACAAAAAFADRPLAKRLWPRLIFPIGIAFLAGVGLLSSIAHIEREYVPHDWYIQRKIMLRLGLSDIGETVQIALRYPLDLIRQTRGFLFVLIGLWGWTARFPAGPKKPESSFDARFTWHALWLFPLGWFLFLPNMHQHDFQGLFAIPFLALGLARISEVRLGRVPESQRTRTWLAFLGLLLGVAAWNGFQAAKTEDSPRFRRMAEAAATHSGPDTIVVIDYENRGLWWRLPRRSIGLDRLRLVQEQDHILLMSPDSTVPEGYELLEKTGEFGVMRKIAK